MDLNTALFITFHLQKKVRNDGVANSHYSTGFSIQLRESCTIPKIKKEKGIGDYCTSHVVRYFIYIQPNRYLRRQFNLILKLKPPHPHDILHLIIRHIHVCHPSAACSGGRIVSWIIYCWLVWCERKTLFPAGNLRSFTSKRTSCLSYQTWHIFADLFSISLAFKTQDGSVVFTLKIKWLKIFVLV